MSLDIDRAQMKLKLCNTKDQKKSESDGGSRFKLAARGRQGLKSHMLVGSMCAGTWRRESVATPRYLYDPERKTRDEKRTREEP